VKEEEVAGWPVAALDATVAAAQGRPLQGGCAIVVAWRRGGEEVVARRCVAIRERGAGGEGKVVGTQEERERLTRLAVRRAVSRGWGTSHGCAAREGSRGY
jgi:hypothetical protein